MIVTKALKIRQGPSTVQLARRDRLGDDVGFYGNDTDTVPRVPKYVLDSTPRRAHDIRFITTRGDGE